MFDLAPSLAPPPTRALFDLPLIDSDRETALDDLFAGPRRRVAFVNADCVNIAARDPSYREALRGADRRLPDGSGLALAAAMRGFRLTENLNGTDLFPELCGRAAAEGKSIFFLGGKDGVAAAAAETARRMAPSLRIAGARHGYFDESETTEVIREINASGADILLVGLGAPRQDVWLARHGLRIAADLQLGVGGLFDYYSGRIPRAPLRLRRAGMEWVWRLMMEPRRLARRYLVGNPLFVLRALGSVMAERLDAGLRRALDIAGAGVGLTLLSPLFLALAILIRAENKGPVFFTQTRVGKDGEGFRMIKFRSMYADAEARRAAALASSDRGGVCLKSRQDPRITRIGRFIRKTSIDELPQLINVLLGQMSLVGPRPALQEEVAAFPEAAHRRHDVRPGITGLWQVSGRAEIDFDKMIDMDLAYVRSRSVLFDLILLALTVRAVTSGRGAY